MLAHDTVAYVSRESSRSADPAFADTVSGSLPSRCHNSRLRQASSSAVSLDSSPEDLVFRDELDAIIPSLRAVARGLCGSRDMADDLVLKAMKRGWADRSSLTPDTSFETRMFRILHNKFYTVIRRNARTDRLASSTVRTRVKLPLQQDAILIADFASALQILPPEQREILMLVGAHGMPEAEAAKVVSCTIETVRHRLACGRKALVLLIDGVRRASNVRESDTRQKRIATVKFG